MVKCESCGRECSNSLMWNVTVQNEGEIIDVGLHLCDNCRSFQQMTEAAKRKIKQTQDKDVYIPKCTYCDNYKLCGHIDGRPSYCSANCRELAAKANYSNSSYNDSSDMDYTLPLLVAYETNMLDFGDDNKNTDCNPSNDNYDNSNSDSNQCDTSSSSDSSSSNSDW